MAQKSSEQKHPKTTKIEKGKGEKQKALGRVEKMQILFDFLCRETLYRLGGENPSLTIDKEK